MTESGWVVVRDALTVAEWRDGAAHSHDRPPSSHEAEQTLLRSAWCIQGEVELEVVCDLLFGYGATRGDVVARRRRAAAPPPRRAATPTCG